LINAILARLATKFPEEQTNKQRQKQRHALNLIENNNIRCCIDENMLKKSPLSFSLILYQIDATYI